VCSSTEKSYPVTLYGTFVVLLGIMLTKWTLFMLIKNIIHGDNAL